MENAFCMIYQRRVIQVLHDAKISSGTHSRAVPSTWPQGLSFIHCEDLRKTQTRLQDVNTKQAKNCWDVCTEIVWPLFRALPFVQTFMLSVRSSAHLCLSVSNQHGKIGHLCGIICWLLHWANSFLVEVLTHVMTKRWKTNSRTHNF